MKSSMLQPSGAESVMLPAEQEVEPKNIFSGINKKAQISFADPDRD